MKNTEKNNCNISPTPIIVGKPQSWYDSCFPTKELRDAWWALMRSRGLPEDKDGEVFRGQYNSIGLQSDVDMWMEVCFGESVKSDKLERVDRFIEEALELAQTIEGFGPDRAHALIDYVFSRPVGHPSQEVGGVMLTLAALCNTLGVSISDCAAAELKRVWEKIDTIRDKQSRKPTGASLTTHSQNSIGDVDREGPITVTTTQPQCTG